MNERPQPGGLKLRATGRMWVFLGVYRLMINGWLKALRADCVERKTR